MWDQYWDLYPGELYPILTDKTAAIDATMNQSEQENPDQVANKSNGLVTIPRIPDPFILSRIASLPSAAMESSSNTLKPRLLPVDTQSIDAFNTFTKFPQLPLEVQRMIWKEALPGPKTLLIKPSLRAGRHIMWFLRGDFSTYESNYKLPNEILVSKVALESKMLPFFFFFSLPNLIALCTPDTLIFEEIGMI